MIQLITTAQQTLQPGQSLTFDEFTQSKNSCCSISRITSSVTALKGGIYEVSFGANIGGTTAATPVQIAIEVAGSAPLGGTMQSTPAATTDFNSVSRTLPISNNCGFAVSLTVANNGTVPVVVNPGAVLFIHRIA